MNKHNKNSSSFLILVILCATWLGCSAQPTFGTDQLRLSKTIPLPGVKGRIDHMDVNRKDELLYVAALGNNTLEVVDLASGKTIHSIDGLDEPQGVGYIAQTREIIIANGGTGDCYFYNAQTFVKVATIHLGSDADDVRVDSAEQKIYVGYGSGGIAVIDATTHRQVSDIKLPVHPESFQLDRGLHLLYVNLPDAHIVGMVDLAQSFLIKKWASSASANFPMAMDEKNHRIFVGYRHPAKLIVYDGRSGKQLTSADMTGDADDLYYDAQSKKVYVSGGQGTISIFKEQGEAIYTQTANIPTRSGARTSLWVPEWRMLIVAARAVSGNPAGLLIFQLSK